MAVAAPSPTEIKDSTTPTSLWTTGLVGGVYVLAALAVVFIGVPQLWEMSINSWFVNNLGNFPNATARMLVQIAAAVGLYVFGIALCPNPPKGIRGSIFMGISTIITAFFLVRAFFMILERMAAKFEFAQSLSLLFVGFCLFLFYKFLISDRFVRWSIALEEAGWFDFKSYKRNQGVKVRRFTILGVILLLGSGVYTMVHNNIITVHDWALALPFTNASVTVLPNAQWTIPILLSGLVIWFAWRVVNFPTFADFLIATEAEINKVSWTPKARLIQDTIVVLITVFIITMFLFVVDIFWGWLLSREMVNVLPSDEETKKNITKQVNTNEY